uniref:Zinc finger protein YGR067C n=1 Tax=Echinococcus granulosus TaxID=6210 RepID=A0A068WCJ9_ECHGR|nr:zinc finger protein YGR067C [Echinococcus granulosus]
MALEGGECLDDSLVWRLKHAISQHITFSRNLVVSGIISYSVDGCSEKFVKINFSLDGQEDANGVGSPTESPIESACTLSVETKPSECHSSASPPILSSNLGCLSVKNQSNRNISADVIVEERRGRRKSNKPRRQLLTSSDIPLIDVVTSTDLSGDEKNEDESTPSKKARHNEFEESQLRASNSVVVPETPQPGALQALLASLVGAGFKLDPQKSPDVNPFITNLPCGLSLTDQSLIQRIAPNGQGSVPFADVMLRQNLQASTSLSADHNPSSLLTAICETPGQPPKSVFISKSVAAAFAAATASGNNTVATPVLQAPQPSQSANVLSDESLNSEQNDVRSGSSLGDATTTLENGNVNFLRCGTISQSIAAPISINLPITTNATLQPTLTVIGSLPNSLTNSTPATILSIGNPNNRNFPAPNNASAITALLRGLSRSKTLATASASESLISKTANTLATEAPVMTSSIDAKPVSDPPSAPQLPLDISSLTAAVAAVTGTLPRNPTISPGPLPGSVLLSCPKIVPNGDQNSPIMNAVSQRTNDSPVLTTDSGTIVTEQIKSEPPLKESPDSTIDRILENIRGQLRASEAEKAARASLVTSNTCVRKMKVSEAKPPSLISQSGGVRLQLPIKKGSGKLAPVAPNPATRTGLSASINLSNTNSTSTITSAMESVHKVYKCRYCGKTFNRKFCRERHERLHTGVKPYTCEICNEKFIRLEDKKRHVRSILHTSRVAAAQASGKLIPAGLDPQDMSEGDASPTSEHTFCMEDPGADTQAEAESSEDPIPVSASPSPPTQATYKHFRRSELKQSVTPVRLLSTEGAEPG